MGCDIHIVVERKWKDKWIGVDALRGHHDRMPKPESYLDGWTAPIGKSRNYERFAALAAVRGDGPEPRGLPDDVSDLCAMERETWGSDGHSDSWLPMDEACAVFARTNRADLSEYASKYPWSYFFNVEDGTVAIADYRIVFWFDN